MGHFFLGTQETGSAGVPSAILRSTGVSPAVCDRFLPACRKRPASQLAPEGGDGGGGGGKLYDHLAALVLKHRTTLIFVNTRRLAEWVAHHISERLRESVVMAHYGSLAREHRRESVPPCSRRRGHADSIAFGFPINPWMCWPSKSSPRSPPRTGTSKNCSIVCAGSGPTAGSPARPSTRSYRCSPTAFRPGFGNTSYRILGIQSGQVLVEDAKG